jgi:trypsin-like peptidase
MRERFDLLLPLVAMASLIGSEARAQKPLPDAEPGQEVVGVSAPLRLDPRLELAFRNGNTWVWGEALTVPDAAFLKAHFEDVNLRAGDVLVLRSASGTVVEEIRGRGPKDLGTFWALSAFGDVLELEFRFAQPYARAPFRIDQVILGNPAMTSLVQTPESVCLPEDFDDVFCYQGDAGKWSNVMASVGVMSVGGDPASALFCSGSNISPDNYVLTNQHCIISQGSCDSSEFVFKYYRTGCNTGAPVTADWQGFRCDDVVVTQPYVACDATLGTLDFSLCSVIGDPAATYGYATPDPVRLTDGEAIYIVQHPDGRPHEITHGSGADVDVDGTVLRYYSTLDTDGGSSGSPIYRESDDKLVGLHHCGGCEFPGVGNTGMLMADIYPEIEEFLCAGTVQLVADEPSAPEQLQGDGDSVVEPGETWRFRPRVRNLACSLTALGVTAKVAVNAASAGVVALLDTNVAFGAVAAGATATGGYVRFRVLTSGTCGAEAILDLVDLQATNGGAFPDTLAIVARPIGDAPLDTIRYDDFTNAPAGWTIVNGGTGSGTASTWTTANPGARSLALTAPFYIADSDKHGTLGVMDEELISPAVNCNGYVLVQLQFSHDFRWYSGGLDEQCDVQVRSTATGGNWVTVANFQDASASGTVLLDISAHAAGQANLQVRFHYYNAVFEFWWAVDDVFVLGSNGYDCDVYEPVIMGPATPVGGGRPLGVH